MPKNSQADKELVFLPLGGAGEIGMNLYLYGFGSARKRKWLMVDLGITFGDFRHPGIDTILPDISFIEEVRDDLVGIVITHAHEDHYGAVQTLWPRLRHRSMPHVSQLRCWPRVWPTMVLMRN